MEKTAPFQTQTSNKLTWVTSLAGTKCDFFEKQWLDCASKLGLTRAEKDCKFQKEDMSECVEMSISYKRYMRMQEERQKKGLPYQDPPPYDTLADQRFKNIVF
jgi:hypothetical protein